MLMFAGFILMMCLWYVYPQAVSMIDVSGSFDPGYGINEINFHLDKERIPSNAILLSDLNAVMVCWLLLRGSFFFAISLFVIHKVIDVLKRVRQIKTFYIDNIQRFKTISRILFIGFIVSCFNFSYIAGDFRLGLTIAWSPLLFSMASLVLAEIFKEGKELLEDKNMIV